MDALRGIAALWVFVFHIRGMISGAWSSQITGVGFLGVWIFFVVSGYCVSASAFGTIARSESSASFIWRRLVRIYPPFWISIVVIVSIPLFVAILSGVNSGRFQPHVNYNVLAPRDWLEIVTLTRDILSPDKGFYPPSGVYWTLAIEVQFYLLVFLIVACRLPLFATSTLVALLAAIAQLFDVKALFAGNFLPYWLAFWMGATVLKLRHQGLSSPKVLERWALPVACVGFVVVPFRIADWSRSPGSCPRLGVSVSPDRVHTKALMKSRGCPIHGSSCVAGRELRNFPDSLPRAYIGSVGGMVGHNIVFIVFTSWTALPDTRYVRQKFGAR